MPAKLDFLWYNFQLSIRRSVDVHLIDALLILALILGCWTRFSSRRELNWAAANHWKDEKLMWSICCLMRILRRKKVKYKFEIELLLIQWIKCILRSSKTFVAFQIITYVIWIILVWQVKKLVDEGRQFKEETD